MASEDPNLWPYNPEATRPSTKINWFAVEVDVLRDADPALLRKVNKNDLATLMRDGRLEPYRAALSEAARDAVSSVLEGRAVRDRGIPDVDPKKAIKSEIERVLGEAETSADFSAQLKSIELLAKLDALLSDKKQIDPVITIIVDTGVVR